MAKVAFSKLNKIKNSTSIKHSINDIEIEIEQYLPLERKIKLMGEVIGQAGSGEEGFFNIVKLDAYYKIEMLQAYTNISFTDKQLEDTPKLFDAIQLNNIWDTVGSLIPESERTYIWNNILNLAKEITSYNNSILGILKSLEDGKALQELDIEALMKELSNPETLPLIRGMLTKNM